jgi:hypothetical protein
MTIATASKPQSISARLADRLREENEQAMDQYDALVIDLANGLDVDTDYIRETLRKAFPDLPPTDDEPHRPGDRAARILDADLKRMETRFELAADVAKAESTAAEKKELQSERRELIERLQNELQPIEQRLSEIEALEAKRDRARDWLRRNPPKNLLRAVRKVQKEIYTLTNFIEHHFNPLTAADRELIKSVDYGDGQRGWTAWPGTDSAAAQEAIQRTKATEQAHEQKKQVARARIEQLEKQLERLTALSSVALPTAEMIEAALYGDSEEMPEPEHETDDSAELTDEE